MLPGERPAPDECPEVRADKRHREHDGIADCEPHAGEQVVGERIAEVTLEQRGEQHRQADPVRELARLAVRAGEEDAHQVQDDRRHEHVRGPVVRLADQQPGLHVQRDVDDRLVGVAHADAAQRRVRAAGDRAQETSGAPALQPPMHRRRQAPDRPTGPRRTPDGSVLARAEARLRRPHPG